MVKDPSPLETPTAMATKVPQGNPACPSSAPSSFPDKGVSLAFLTQFRDSTKMKQPMHELAGLTRSQIDATELPALRDICKQYRVLATVCVQRIDEANRAEEATGGRYSVLF